MKFAERLTVQEYLMGELILVKLPRYHISWELAHVQLARSCMCYLSIYLNPPPVNSSNMLPGVSFAIRDRLHMMSRPLLHYVLDDAIDHFQHLGSRFQLVLRDIKVLAGDIRQHPNIWDNLCRSAKRDEDSACWPISKHDLTLYILVTCSPSPPLQTFLRYTAHIHKERSNPLVYAAYFNKEEHARTLLSRGARLNRRGWDIDGFFQVLPIEVALQNHHWAIVALFVQEGSTIPPYIFTSSFFRAHLYSSPSSIWRTLLQTDDFVEAVNDPLNEPVCRLKKVSNRLSEGERSFQHDLAAILRRYIQVVNEHLVHSREGEESLRVALACEDFSLARYLLSLGASLPSDLPHGMHNSLGRQKMITMIHLLAESGDVDAYLVAEDSLLYAILHPCSQEDALETAKLLIDRCNPLKANSLREAILRIAVRCGLVSVARYLLSFGISPSPDLLDVALGWCDASMVVCLLESGPRVYAQTTFRGPVLYTVLKRLRHREEHALKAAKLLVGYDCNPLGANPSGETPLHIAVQNGLLSVAQYLLSLGISPSPDLLHLAVKSETQQVTVPMVNCILEYGADVHFRTVAGDSVLHSALLSLRDDDCALQIAKLLVAHGCNPFEASPSEGTLLYIAVKRGLVSVVKYLLSLGISPSVSPDLLLVPLRSSIQGLKILPMINCLLENGANVHVRAADGEPLLHTLLSSTWQDNTLQIAEALVSHGCDPLEANLSGKTPLRITVERRLVPVARYFLSLGISPSPDLLHAALRWKDGQIKTQMVVCLLEYITDVCICTANGEPLLHTLLSSTQDEEYAVQTAEALVSRGCDPLEANPSGKTPLRIAVERRLVVVARYFLSLGISPSPDLLHTALRWMDGRIKKQMVVCLLEHITDVCICTANGEPLLHTLLSWTWDEEYAAQTAEALISRGCDPLETNPSGKTPLRIMVERGFFSGAQYLLSLGISPSPDLLHIVSGLQGRGKKDKLLMIISLLRSGVDVHARIENEDPVLHTTLLSSGDDDYALQTAKVLIDYGCDPLEASSSGKTPLRIAVERSFLSVAQYLLSLGVSPPPGLLHIVSGLKGCREKNKLLMIISLLESGADVHACVENGSPVLHTTLLSSEDEDYALQTAKVLIEYGCDPLAVGPSRKTPLHIAVERGFMSIAQCILSLCSSPPSHLMHVALGLKDRRRKLRMIVCLLENGLDIHAGAGNGDPVLHAVMQSDLEEDVLRTAKVLVGHGCSLLETCSSGKTSLQIAVERGFVSVARYLLSLGPPPASDLLLAMLLPRNEQQESQILGSLESGANSIYPHGANPLFHVSLYHDPVRHTGISDNTSEILKLLVSQGCSPLDANSHGEVPLCVAVEQGRTVVAQILLSLCVPFNSPCDVLRVVLLSKQIRCKLQMANFLIDQGANVLAKAQNGDSMLHTAIASIDDDEVLEIVTLLLGQGCDPMVPNERGITPLHVAVERGHISVVKLFLSQNVPLPPDILFAAIRSVPAFGWDASHRRLKIVKLLVTSGCDTKTRNSAGLSVLDAAHSEGHLDVIDYLLSAPTLVRSSGEHSAGH